MRILFNMKIGVENTGRQIFDIGKSIETDLHFVTNAIHINMYQGWCFQHKSAFHISDHESECKRKKA